MTYILYLAEWIIPSPPPLFNLLTSRALHCLDYFPSSLFIPVSCHLFSWTVGCSRALYKQLDIFGHKDATVSTTTHISSLDLFEFQIHMPTCLFERLRWSLAGMSNVCVPSLIPYLSRHLKCLRSKSNLLSSSRVRINSESS